MKEHRLECPKCAHEMEAGFLFDRMSWFEDGKPLLWIEGSQVGRSKHAGPEGPGRLEVDAYRCLGCGFVELWAGAPSAGA